MPLDPTASESKPFIKLGDPSKAPILDYNLPQEACYTAEGYAVINVPAEYFGAEAIAVPVKNPWSENAGLALDSITDKLRDELITGQSSVMLGASIVKNAPAAIKVISTVEVIQPTPSTQTPPIIRPPLEVENSAIVGREDFGAFSQANLTDQVLDKAPILETGPILKVETAPLATATESNILIAGVPLNYVATQIKKGKLPRIYKRFSGALAMEFLKEPVAPQPTLTIVEHYRICSYLGNYGAGKVVQTFSLLPGERTQITIKSYKNQSGSESTTASSQQTSATDTNTSSQVGAQSNSSDTSVKNKSENILDSFSEASANELEELVSKEVGVSNYEDANTSVFSGTSTSSVNTPKVTTKGSGLKINLGIIAFGSGKGTTSGGTTTTSDTSRGMTATAARGNATNALESAINKHVARSSANRDMQVNTTTGSSNTQANSSGASSQTGTSSGTSTGSVITMGSASESMRAVGDENLNVRELQNINLSRTLNFVFRQMQQEYVTIMYLNDISVVYSNGYPNSEEHVRLPDLDRLLTRVLKTETARQEMRDEIARHACNIYDYRGQRVSFAERYTEEQTDCGASTNLGKYTYLRKRPALGVREAANGNTEDTYNNITVPGIILSVQTHILRTDSLLVDTVLGQGEALDFYNASLQQLAVERAKMENARISAEIGRTNAESDQLRRDDEMITWKQGMANKIIDLISDPAQKAEAYQKIFAEYSLQDILDLLTRLQK